MIQKTQVRGQDTIKMKLQVKIADKVIALHPHDPKLCEYCAAYRTEEEKEDFSCSWSEEEIRMEQEPGTEEGIYTMPYLETLTALRKMAEKFPYYERLLFHGAAITFRDDAYLFTAPSGTGKSTHISLWKKYLGKEVDIINGDKPVLAIEKDGDSVRTTVYGTPWAGKERWQKNRSAELKGICFLRQSRENKIRALQPGECAAMLLRQVYLPEDEKAAGLTMELLDRMLTAVPVYVLECDRSEEAVRLSFETLTKEKYHT